MAFPDFSKLSDREMDVLTALVELYSYTQVAESLGITQKSVQTYMERARTKTGLINTMELVLNFDRWLWRERRKKANG